MDSAKLQLLLVEDDIDLATAVIDYFELEKIQCEHASNGLSGFNLITSNATLLITSSGVPIHSRNLRIFHEKVRPGCQLHLNPQLKQ